MAYLSLIIHRIEITTFMSMVARRSNSHIPSTSKLWGRGGWINAPFTVHVSPVLTRVFAGFLPHSTNMYVAFTEDSKLNASVNSQLFPFNWRNRLCKWKKTYFFASTRAYGACGQYMRAISSRCEKSEDRPCIAMQTHQHVTYRCHVRNIYR